MSDVVTLCPACGDELPDGYELDHVAVDLALASRPELFARMDSTERGEVIRTGLRRGIPISTMAQRFHRSNDDLRDIAGEKPTDTTLARQRFAEQVRDLYEQDMTDGVIAMRLGSHISHVGVVRKRLGLQSKHGPGGRRRKELTA